MAKPSTQLRLMQAQQDIKRLLEEIARLQEDQADRDRERDHFVRIMCRDMAFIALHDAFGFGADRLNRFANAYADTWIAWATATTEDAKDDKTAEYSREKYEEKLKQILEKYYIPREERYK